MFNSTKHKINQAKCLRGTKNTQDFCGCQEALIGYACTHVCVCVCECVAVWTAALLRVSWITFLPVCLILFPSSAGLDFLLGELGLFEEAYWARSLEGCQDQPWLTNTSEGSKVTGPNISSITEQTLWGLPSPGTGAPSPWLLTEGSFSCADE